MPLTDTGSCDSLIMRDSLSTRPPSRLPSILIRRRATRSPSPPRQSNDQDQLIPKVVRTKTFGIPDDEDSPKVLLQDNSGSYEGTPMTSHTETDTSAAGVASTRFLHQPTYQKLSLQAMPSTPGNMSGSPSSSELHLQTPPPEIIAQALSTHSDMLIQQSALLAEVSQRFGQLAREALQWEGWLRHNLPKTSMEDKAVQASPGRLRTVSFQGDPKLETRNTLHSTNSWDNLHKAEQAWDRAMKVLNDVRGLLDELRRPSQVLSDEASCGSCSQGPCLTRQNSKAQSQSSHLSPPGSEYHSFYRPESQHTFRQSKSHLQASPEQHNAPLIYHPVESTDHTDVKSSEESSSSEWICADVSASVQTEQYHSAANMRQTSTDSCRAEFQRRIASVPPDENQNPKTTLAPVLEVDSLRFTVSRSSMRGAFEFQSPSQPDLTSLARSASQTGSASSHRHSTHRFMPPVPSFQSIRRDYESDRTVVWQQPDHHQEHHPEHRRSLVIGTKSENPTVPERARSPPAEGGALLRTFSRRGRRWWRNMVE